MPGRGKTLLKAWKVFVRMATMPWTCQQAAIEQILRQTNLSDKERQLQDWKKFKTNEFTNVSFIVSTQADLGSIMFALHHTYTVTGNTSRFGNHRLITME
jgi:hypothetical protein